MFYLGVAYAANIGGTGTLTASEPNVIMKGILEEKFPCQARSNFDGSHWLGYQSKELKYGQKIRKKAKLGQQEYETSFQTIHVLFDKSV